jgi:hypothetical protein
LARQRIKRHRYGRSRSGHRLAVLHLERSGFRRFGWWLLFVSVSGFASLHWVVQPHAPELIPETFADLSDLRPPLVVSTSLPRAERPVYPYSVIPGGIESPQELKEAMARDPVVAAHYRDFDLSALRIVRLKSERTVYVSYRLHNDIFWTGTQLKLAAGERLITDGNNSARTRCGNRISEIPQVKVLPSGPSALTLETPQSPEAYSPLNRVLPFEAEIPNSPVSPLAPPGVLASSGGVGGGPIGGRMFPPLPGGSLFPPPCIPSFVPAARLQSSNSGGQSQRDRCGPPPCVPKKGHPCAPVVTPFGPPPPVPEPGTWLLLSPGLTYLFYRWKLRS